jgi:hypothetical protein
LELNRTSKHIEGQHGDLPENKGEKSNDVNKMKTIPATAAADENVVQQLQREGQDYVAGHLAQSKTYSLQFRCSIYNDNIHLSCVLSWDSSTYDPHTNIDQTFNRKSGFL